MSPRVTAPLFLKNVIGMFEERKRKSVKRFWSTIKNPCSNSALIFDALEVTERQQIHKILEFGASWGGNLRYFMDHLPGLQTVGIDVNPVVAELATRYPNYTGIIGDEAVLKNFASEIFDLSFTVSVLDHIPVDRVVEDIIVQLVHISKHVILLEPFIDGVHGDVSDKTRNQVKRGLERGHKPFAAYSYLWNYDRMLDRIGSAWQKHAIPLHAGSLGPYYHLYSIRGARDTA